MSVLDSKMGRIILHLLAYGAAAGGIAILGQLQVIDFGQYQAVASVLIGAAIDYLRKSMTPL